MKVNESTIILDYIDVPPSLNNLLERINNVYQQVSSQTQTTYGQIENQVTVLYEQSEPAIAIIKDVVKYALAAVYVIKVVQHTSNTIYRTEKTNRLNEAYEIAKNTTRIATILTKFTVGSYLFSTTDLIISAYILSYSLYAGAYDKALLDLMHTGEHFLTCALLITSFAPLSVVFFASKMFLHYSRPITN